MHDPGMKHLSCITQTNDLRERASIIEPIAPWPYTCLELGSPALKNMTLCTTVLALNIHSKIDNLLIWLQHRDNSNKG